MKACHCTIPAMGGSCEGCSNNTDNLEGNLSIFWTQKEIDDAKKEADEYSKILKWEDHT